MNITEKDFQEKIVEALTLTGWTVLEYAKPGGHSRLAGAVRVGHADLLALRKEYLAIRPRVVFLEIKTKRGHQSVEQIGFGVFVQGAGAEYYVIRSLQDLRKALGLEELEIQ